MRQLAVAAALLAAALLAVETFARLSLGLGAPPLSVPHPTIEYMFRPDQDVMRFGRHIFYNEVGMRSGPLPAVVAMPIVLTMGDSVLNGGSLTDQSDLATERLVQRLAAEGRPAYIGNVSAGGWGPANHLAWLKEYGLIGAEAVVLVVSSGYADDVPSFAPLDPATHPTETPPLALWEAITRYLPRYLPRAFLVWPPLTPAVTREVGPEQKVALGAGLGYLRRLAVLLKTEDVPLCAVRHLGPAELTEGAGSAAQRVRDGFAVLGVPMVDSRAAYRAALARGVMLYRDHIHLTPEVQEVLAGLIERCLRSVGRWPSSP